MDSVPCESQWCDKKILLPASCLMHFNEYASSLSTQGGTADNQYYLAAMTLKTSQDKSNGAMIAGIGTKYECKLGVIDEQLINFHFGRLVGCRQLRHVVFNPFLV